MLIVDDDRTNLRLLGSLLTTRCNVSVALDGTQALKLLATQPDIALVFLDLQLPDMSGYAVAQALRADPG
ncbi:MAG: response regulator, partial [Candidatus Competibacterales bacterium]